MKTILKYVAWAVGALMLLVWYQDQSEVKQTGVWLSVMICYVGWTLGKSIDTNKKTADDAIERLHERIRQLEGLAPRNDP